MNKDKLYELAFAYKKTKLWKKLMDTELFAVKLAKERIGYVSIMGFAGEFQAVGLYIGDEGFQSFLTVAKTDQSSLTFLQCNERMMQQKCLQCAFESKDELSKEEREEAKQYARSHGIRIAGKNAYPQFVKYEPYCCPWHLETEQEQEDLCQVLEASIAMAKMLEAETKEALGIGRVDYGAEELLMLEPQAGGWTVGRIPVPEERSREWPVPKGVNDIGMANLGKLEKAGEWECEIVRFPQAAQDSEEEIPYFPVIFMAVERETGYMLPVSLVKNYEEHPEELLNCMIDAFLMKKMRPKKMLVRDDRTFLFLKAFCKRTKISIHMEEDLYELDEAEKLLLEEFGKDQEDMLEDIGAMLQEIKETGGDEDVVEAFSRELAKYLELDEASLSQMFSPQTSLPQTSLPQTSLPQTALPQTSSRRTSSLPTSSPQSYVISVSLGKGCYRHIQIASESTLLLLHKVILDAFSFDDDHAHAFFMDNHSWSEEDCYYMEGLEEDEEDRTTGEYTLSQAGLHKGMMFKYIFDFGDEWTFQCKVLRVLDGDTEVPMIIQSKGTAPKQY